MTEVMVEQRGPATWIRLCAPQRRNAYDPPMAAAITEAVENSAGSHAVVITGSRDFLGRTLVSLTGSEVLGPAVMPGPVLHMASFAGPAYDGAPAIGEHTAPVLTQALRLTPAELAGLAERGVIARA